jgi:sugar lactone lactonase YvrE
MTVEGQPSGLGWLPDGSLLVVSMKDHRVLRRWPGGEVTEHADVSAHCGGLLNDMIVDADGRAYVGNFGFDPETGEEVKGANLVRVDPDGSIHVAASDLMVPNGCVLSAEGRILIVGESMGCRYTAYDVALNGGLSNRRVWAQMTPGPPRGALERSARTFVPDGCTLDANGRIWSADPIGRR